MFSHDGKIFKIMGTAGNYCLLNLLWIVFSLPVITVFASTAAMLGVVKDWSGGKEPPIIKTFFKYGMKHLKRSSLIGVMQIGFVMVLVCDFIVIWNMDGNLKVLLLPLLSLLGMMFVFMSFYIYPLLVEFDLPIKPLLRNSFYLTISRPASAAAISLICCLIVFICTFLRFLPFLCAFSLAGFISFYIVKRTIRKMDKVLV